MPTEFTMAFRHVRTNTFSHLKVSDLSNFIIRPECVPVKCRSPPKIVHGSSLKIFANYRDVLQVTCDPGYTMRGDTQVTCLETGQWSQKIVSCEPVTCEDITKFTHGGVHYSQRNIEGNNANLVDTMAIFSCNNGFQLIGPKNISCQENGKWSPDIPKCQRKCTTHQE